MNRGNGMNRGSAMNRGNGMNRGNAMNLSNAINLLSRAREQAVFSDFRHGWFVIILWIVYAILWFGGVGSHVLFGATPAGMNWTAPLLLWVGTLLTFIAAPDDWRTLAISFVAGIAIEVVGVATGFPFGRYNYTPVLGFAILAVPLAMGCAWVILLAWVRQLRLPVLAAAAVMTAVDLGLDPVTTRILDLWRWRTPGRYYGVPWTNYAGWFAVSLILFACLPPGRHNPNVFAVGSTVLLLFALIGLAHGFFVPSSMLCLLCGAGYWRWRASSNVLIST
jgi:putative membrane protein